MPRVKPIGGNPDLLATYEDMSNRAGSSRPFERLGATLWLMNNQKYVKDQLDADEQQAAQQDQEYRSAQTRSTSALADSRELDMANARELQPYKLRQEQAQANKFETDALRSENDFNLDNATKQFKIDKARLDAQEAEYKLKEMERKASGEMEAAGVVAESTALGLRSLREQSSFLRSQAAALAEDMASLDKDLPSGTMNPNRVAAADAATRTPKARKAMRTSAMSDIAASATGMGSLIPVGQLNQRVADASIRARGANDLVGYAEQGLGVDQMDDIANTFGGLLNSARTAEGVKAIQGNFEEASKLASTRAEDFTKGVNSTSSQLRARGRLEDMDRNRQADNWVKAFGFGSGVDPDMPTAKLKAASGAAKEIVAAVGLDSEFDDPRAMKMWVEENGGYDAVIGKYPRLGRQLATFRDRMGELESYTEGEGSTQDNPSQQRENTAATMSRIGSQAVMHFSGVATRAKEISDGGGKDFLVDHRTRDNEPPEAVVRNMLRSLPNQVASDLVSGQPSSLLRSAYGEGSDANWTNKVYGSGGVVPKALSLYNNLVIYYQNGDVDGFNEALANYAEFSGEQAGLEVLGLKAGIARDNRDANAQINRGYTTPYPTPFGWGDGQLKSASGKRTDRNRTY